MLSRADPEAQTFVHTYGEHSTSSLQLHKAPPLMASSSSSERL